MKCDICEKDVGSKCHTIIVTPEPIKGCKECMDIVQLLIKQEDFKAKLKPHLTDKLIYKIMKATDNADSGTKKIFNALLNDLIYYKYHYEGMKKAFDWLEEVAIGVSGRVKEDKPNESNVSRLTNDV